MKIAIIDTGRAHYTYLYSLCKIFEIDNLYLYVSEQLMQSLKNSKLKKYNNIKFKIKGKDSSLKLYYANIVEEINNSDIDLVFINTVHGNFIQNSFLTSKLKKKKILTIHNLNNYAKPKVVFSIKSNIRSIFRRKIMNNCEIINVYGENLQSYLIEDFKYEKIITTLPFSIFEEELIKRKPNNSKLVIAIPGSIDEDRRDYKSVYNVFKKIYSEGYDIELKLLGRPIKNTANKLIDDFEDLNSVKVQVYRGFVSEEIFEKEMWNSDLILGLTKKNIIFDSTEEEYGKTKETGTTFAMIRYSLPGIISSEVRKMKELENSTLTCSSEEELYKIILKLYLNPCILDDLKKNALINSRKFTPSSVREKFLRQVVVMK